MEKAYVLRWAEFLIKCHVICNKIDFLNVINKFFLSLFVIWRIRFAIEMISFTTILYKIIENMPENYSTTNIDVV